MILRSHPKCSCAKTRPCVLALTPNCHNYTPQFPPKNTNPFDLNSSRLYENNKSSLNTRADKKRTCKLHSFSFATRSHFGKATLFPLAPNGLARPNNSSLSSLLKQQQQPISACNFKPTRNITSFRGQVDTFWPIIDSKRPAKK